MDDDFPILPPELIRNILERIPVKSLMRFQCVCKGWRILFKTQSFIADHLDHSNHQNPCLLIKDGDIDNDLSNMCWLDSEMQVWKFQNQPLLSYLKQGRILGSSNGLLCVEIHRHDASPHFLLVWNPAIREVRLVPETNIRKKDCYNLIEFGFSPIINDYKIVIGYFPFDHIHTDVSIVKVYSLSSGSWKEKKIRLNGTRGVTSPGVTVNGVVFCWGYKVGQDGFETVIVSFDLAVEVFTVIPIPQLHEHSGFAVYEEKLALFSWMIQDSTHSVIDLWVMEEGVGSSGEIWSWTKKYSINPYPCFLSPMTIWRNEIVGYSLEKDERTVVFLNLTTKKTWKFAIGEYGYKGWISNYAESLVPVGGIKSSTIFL